MTRRFLVALTSAVAVLGATFGAVRVGADETVALHAPQAAPTVHPFVIQNTPLYGRMIKVNAGLRSYRSHVHLAIAMHSFPFLSPTLEGTVYYKSPDKNAIVFDSVPALASLFKKVFPRLDPPATWPILYTISQLGTDSQHTTLRLSPKKYGTIDHLDVVVDENSALPVAYTYVYRNGGYVHFEQKIELIDNVYVITALDGHVELPSTTADAHSIFSDYRINIPINDDVFSNRES